MKRPRPGHADFAGGQKFGARDLRNILERASARETASAWRAARLRNNYSRSSASNSGATSFNSAGCRLSRLSWRGGVSAIPEDAPLRCADAEAQGRMVALVDEKRRAGDTLGGIFEVVARGLVAGLGSHMSWDEKLDGRLAQASCRSRRSRPSSIGAGVEAASCPARRSTTRSVTTPTRAVRAAPRTARAASKAASRTARSCARAATSSPSRRCGRRCAPWTSTRRRKRRRPSSART